MEEGSFIGPYDTREAHLAAVKNPPGGIIPIRIRGHLHLGPRSRVGLNTLVEGNLAVGADSYIEDSVVEQNVLICDGVVVRRNAVIRGRSVCGNNSRFECAADFEGVAGKGTIYMHPGQCWVVTGEGCDLGAGNFFGTWRFDSGICTYRIGGRSVKPKCDEIGNASYLGDQSRTGVGVMIAPGTRVGPDCMLGIGFLPSGRIDAGYAYLPKQNVAKARTSLLTRKKRTD
jgi:NDP-sugar pyrophosphorylase family protein